jgi:hypothetical protein
MKTFKTAIAALALAALPTIGFAMCSGMEHKNTTAASCPQGMVFDPATGTCVAAKTS